MLTISAHAIHHTTLGALLGALGLMLWSFPMMSESVREDKCVTARCVTVLLVPGVDCSDLKVEN